MHETSQRSSRPMRCAGCARSLADGTPAVWERGSQRLLCRDCSAGAVPGAEPIDQGTAGLSAHVEYRRRMARHEAKVRAEWGDAADDVLRERVPHHAMAWEAGAAGEQMLAAAVGNLPGVMPLHDRRVPGTRGNIDHLLVAPAGVFVVDSKLQRGRVRFGDVQVSGTWETRLYVGRRDRSKIAESLEWQTAAVENALDRAGLNAVPTWPVACFVGRGSAIPLGEFRGVSLETEQSLCELLLSAHELDAAAVHHVARVLSSAFPSMSTRSAVNSRPARPQSAGQLELKFNEEGKAMASPATRPWRVKYNGPCARCGTVLVTGAPAVWDNRKRTMRCIECPTASVATPLARPAELPPPTEPVETPIDYGTAGASAQREYDRRRAKDEAAVKRRWGDRIGGLILALSDEEQTTAAWARGAAGEAKLAKAFGELAGIHVLNDRQVRGTRRNIDHIVVASGGVFVVDAKNYKGVVQIRNKGWFFRPDNRLYVGGRDCSKLAEAMAWQVEAVRSALPAAGIDALPPITPVLCFIDADWPLFGAPDSFRGVLLEGPRSLRKRVVREPLLGETDAERIVRVLAAALPAK